MEYEIGDIIVIYDKINDLEVKGTQGTITAIGKKGWLYGTWGKDILNPNDKRILLVRKASRG